MRIASKKQVQVVSFIWITAFFLYLLMEFSGLNGDQELKPRISPHYSHCFFHLFLRPCPTPLALAGLHASAAAVDRESAHADYADLVTWQWPRQRRGNLLRQWRCRAHARLRLERQLRLNGSTRRTGAIREGRRRGHGCAAQQAAVRLGYVVDRANAAAKRPLDSTARAKTATNDCCCCRFVARVLVLLLVLVLRFCCDDHGSGNHSS